MEGYALALFIIVALTQVLDALSTVSALRKPGNYEANPFMRWLFAKFGMWPTLILGKAFFLSIIGYGLYTDTLVMPWITGAIIIIYSVVVINNCRR